MVFAVKRAAVRPDCPRITIRRAVGGGSSMVLLPIKGTIHDQTTAGPPNGQKSYRSAD